MRNKKSGAPSPRPAILNCNLNLGVARQKKGVSLEHVAESTKISLRFLRAIEAEEFDKLPGGIFATSYLKQYAAAIGFDESRLLARYEGQMKPPPPETKPPGIESRTLFDRWFRIAASEPRS